MPCVWGGGGGCTLLSEKRSIFLKKTVELITVIYALGVSKRP